VATDLLRYYWQLSVNFASGTVSAEHVFHLSCVTPGATAQDVIDCYHWSIDYALSSCISVYARVTNLVCLNCALPTDFASDWSGSYGLRTGQMMPCHDTAVIRFPRVDRRMKDGSKRIPYIMELDVVHGILTATYQGILDVLAAAIVAPWVNEAETVTCRYCTISRIKYLSPKGRVCWRMPENDEELRAYIMPSWVIVPRVSSQVSRKPG